METHKITIGKKGNVSIAVSGVQGTGCKESTKRIEAALGLTTNDEETGEFYATGENLETEYQ